MSNEVTVYTYEVIGGEHKGQRVKSFESVFFDARLCIAPPPNMPICCFDDKYEYILHAGDLKLLGESVMSIPNFNGKTIVEKPKLTDEQIKNLEEDGFFDDVRAEKDRLGAEIYFED